MDAIVMTKQTLNDRVPLIGFAGSPWTIFCYAVQGQGSRNFDIAKSFAFTEPEPPMPCSRKSPTPPSPTSRPR